MPDLTAQQTCNATKGPVYDTGAGFMTSEVTTRFGLDAGYEDMLTFYLAGRCGVLGDVDADVVAAAFGFFHPSSLREVWDRALQVRPAREAAALYTQALVEASAPAVEDFDGARRLADLAELVVDAASPAGLPLFAGWRAVPRPVAPGARATHALHLLREWRGGAHVAATAAAALPPLDAVMLDGGAGYAEFYRWPQPWGDGAGRREAAALAERLTDAQCVPVFEAALTPTERGELADLVGVLASRASTPA